jgi:hypothetical protein
MAASSSVATAVAAPLTGSRLDCTNVGLFELDDHASLDASEDGAIAGDLVPHCSHARAAISYCGYL